MPDRACAPARAGPIEEFGDYLDLGGPLRDVVGGLTDAGGPADGVRSRLAGYFAARDIDRSTLWKTLPEAGDAAAAARWSATRGIRQPPFDVWTVPADPTWAEDPFRNRSWQTFYQSLAWLRAAAVAARQESDPQARLAIVRYVTDWIADNPPGNAASARSWYDHAAAYRTDAIVGLFPLLADEARPAQLLRILRSLHQHGAFLECLLSDPRFAGHNHNLFHALSLYNLAAALPELRDADRWRSSARTRISSLLPEIVDPIEGVSTEGAAAYHFLVLRLLVAADAFLERHGDSLSAGERGVLARMAEFGALLADPGGFLPSIGDTDYGTPAFSSELLDDQALGIATDRSRYALSRGAQGTRPPDAVFWSSTGYALFRPSWGDAGAWEDDLHITVDMGSVRRVHGHRDAMNLLLSVGGEQVLVDSGGPYLYSDPRHADFVATRAHNTVVVDGMDQADGPVRILSTSDQPAASLIDGVHDLFGTVRHRRLVVVLKPATVLVVDRLTDLGGGDHDYDLLFHLAPGANAAVRADGADVTGAEGSRLAIRVAASAPMAVRRLSAERDPMLGWVTTDIGSRVPAPVLQLSMRSWDAWFASLLLPGVGAGSAGPGAPAPRVTALQERGSLLVMIESGDARWCVDVPDDPEGTVRVTATCSAAGEAP